MSGQDHQRAPDQRMSGYDDDMTDREKDDSRRETGGGTALMVRRPVLAMVISLLIVVAGLAGLYGAEIRELPDVDRPVITVTTNFAGASPETVDRELTAIMEGAIARVSGVASMSSTSTLGRSRVTIEFSTTVPISTSPPPMCAIRWGG
jgi:HAE1 family hydrophobic/amphiphilic exporter-1